MAQRKKEAPEGIAPTEDALSSELTILRDELRLHHVTLRDFSGAAERELLDEISYALSPPVHEEHHAPYGAILTDSRFVGHLVPRPVLDVAGDGVGARTAADGSQSFVHIAPGQRRLVVFPTSIGDEATLAALASEFAGVVVQRDSSGLVRIYSEHGIYLNRTRKWWFKPTPYSVLWNLHAYLPMVKPDTLNELLTLAVHVLSPANCGATLVWWLVPPVPVNGATTLDLSQLGLRLDKEHFSAIRNVVSQHDGATFIGPAGEMLSIGTHLATSLEAQRVIPQTRGTRHTSARRYSFDEPRAVVVTVSQDGPVTVFSDGVSIGEVQAYSAEREADGLKEELPEKAAQIVSRQSEVVCTNCGKTMMVEELVIYGWKDTEEAACQVCGVEVAKRRCWRVDARVVKKIDV